jgi:hypothetical protein
MGTAAEQRKSVLLKGADFSKLSFMGINEDEVKNLFVFENPRGA